MAVCLLAQLYYERTSNSPLATMPRACTTRSGVFSLLNCPIFSRNAAHADTPSCANSRALETLSQSDNQEHFMHILLQVAEIYLYL